MIKQLQISSIKALVLTFAVALVSLSSCKKDSGDVAASSTITANIDGTATTFSKFAVAVKGEQDNLQFTSIQGTDDKGFTITLTVYGALQAGKTYLSTDDSSEHSLLGYGDDNSNDIYFSDDVDVTTVTLTKVSNSSLEGTFSGKVSTFTSGKSKVITNGKFNVKIVSK